ncbi:MAG: hypothetical protein Q8R07_00740, partial [Candidatus Uhrbacteria bacterium]|nr:hypothetical protein [Candidatus Uhrbacteria bacterium]
ESVSAPSPSKNAPHQPRVDIRTRPHFRSIGDLMQYLLNQGHLNTAPKIRLGAEREAWRWEQMLMRDLHAAKQGNAPEAQLDELRKLIFAISWDKHPRPDVTTLLRDADRLANEVEKWAKVLGGRGSSPDDKREYLDEYLPRVQKIRWAIQSNACGAKAADALMAIEHFMQETKNTKPPEALRRLRDQIYYQSVYAPWCETAPHEKLH